MGRRDDQVKLGGRRIELAEIDAQLCAAPGVRAAAAAVRETTGHNQILVGYVSGDVDPAEVRAFVAKRLPEGIVPIVVRLDMLPLKGSGKVDRKALPWPPPGTGAHVGGPAAPAAGYRAELTGTRAWLAERWAEQLGPLPLSADSDFFELGGTSLAVARLVSILRAQFPATAVADVYHHRRLGQLADRLDHLGSTEEHKAPPPPGRPVWGVVQLLGVLVLVMLASLQWVIGILAYNQWEGYGLRPGWAIVVAAWLLVSSAPGRAAIVVAARRGLLHGLRPGRYPRQGWLACRLWFVERLAQVFHLDILAGTPWTARYARLTGTDVGKGANLRALPPPTSLLHIGAGASLEADVDVHGWWVEGRELVVGEIHIGEGARVGARTVLMPGADIGAGAEVEPGSVVTGTVPAGERWSGSPARREGRAGEEWPVGAGEPLESAGPDRPGRAGGYRAPRMLYALGITILSALPMVAAVPGIVVLGTLGSLASPERAAVSLLVDAPLVAILFMVTYALLTALVVRSVSPLVKPGQHPENGLTAWALWLSGAAMTRSQGILFPLYLSVYTRSWLRLLGISVGKRTEISTSLGLNRLVRVGETSFAADEVVFAGARARGGQIEIRPIEVGSRTFLGNGAIVRGGTRLGNDSLVGLLSSPPPSSADGTSWFGLPPIEFPRVPEQADPSRTTEPRKRLVLARGAVELVRILLPATVSVVLGALVFLALQSLCTSAGAAGLVIGAPFVVLAGGLGAVIFTIAAKWCLMGRYKPEKHPFWSFFVWRDEIINTCQEQLAGAWLLSTALASPLVPAYLRAMGARVGKGVWFETLAITEFDLVDLGDGCAVNRGACIETHLFHDRVLNMGPARLESGSTLGPSSAVLPDTVLGRGCTVGARSVVMRGERLPAHTSWHGAPVQSW
jgi:non-ribosomal peptide synthetase-like protein